ncbi:MAG: sulfur carrier protein ThiS [Oceanicoccus sp.]|uniref:sulfur carrier protein ThiS n=1 Tax=Oceanicoccus sp. TaxID=2691044 RepID=UPI00262E0D09|nr:sulfur carrier protein ThiS [Oceanicoccus sp.]MDG1773605.1 sulfur carrier protein ThiS [Oceanicoccus sp.]
MITIFLNDQVTEIVPEQSIQQMIAGLSDKPDNFAIAVNENFVPKTEYDQLLLQQGDRVELLVPMQGG